MTDRSGKKYYAVGNSSLQNGVDPQILLADPSSSPTVFNVGAKRTFKGPGDGPLTNIATAGDGGLVFVSANNQLVKLSPEMLSLQPPAYDCASGAITLNTIGGDGSLITYNAPGIARSSLTSNSGTIESGLRNDPKPVAITATQGGQTVTYVFDFEAYCANPQPPATPPATPPVPPTSPTGGALTLLLPGYDCASGAITFRSSGGDGSPVEYAAAGITGWTSNPGQFVDRDSRTANDVQPFVLMARQGGVTVSYVWDLKLACNRARLGVAGERTEQLSVLVLGNPVEGKSAEIEIRSAFNQGVQLGLVDLQGRVFHQQRIEQSGSAERISLPTGDGRGLLLLNVRTATQRQQVKLVKP